MKVPKFKNEPYTDWSKPANRKKQEIEIKKLEAQLGKEYPNIIGGRKIYRKGKLNSINPSDPQQIVGIFQQGTTDDAVRALGVAWDAFKTWSKVPAEKRAAVLFKAAAIMRKRRFHLNAVQMFEVGKTWPEADADVAEAIDFCEFYGREMLRYASVKLPVQLPGEKDEMMYIPLGAGVVVPPWNFPLAILTGMTAAAVVAGNTVVLKPSSDSPLNGYKFMEIMKEAGLPPGVINFLTGPGGTVGETLVTHPRTRWIAFTGSKEVGIHIYEEAAKVHPGQRWLKRVIAEMGGKDSIIVDRETNIDEAAAGVAVSAFGFGGQKCSACSRAIVDEKIYDTFVGLLKKRVETMSVGHAHQLSNFMGPVINKRSFEKIQQYIQRGLNEGGHLVTGGALVAGDGKGYFLHPTVIADVKPKATIAQEEIFGPVLAVIKAKNFDHALEIANNTEFGLTGAVFTRNKKKLAKARAEFFCGNLYLNRKCTGAMVGAHPFGGFNMSGTDSKAGGQDYLLLFLQAKTVATKVR
ncbi:MAG: L-glutamate gamma-semialdehyde dehydrogenase [Ignavibacteriae bacterium]|nr:L-glutamate gamma-semialdehyde dehydrogenase [Ignavibacteria bacterium]MBI3363648.1 L-glutamate gamma-semialdehyde dehydrogenase [Ignavibacteriota bacterium]